MKRVVIGAVVACVVLSLQAAPADHAYFEALIRRSDHWVSFDLRNPKTLGRPLDGGLADANDTARGLWVTYDPANDTDPHRQDAAKVVIPTFHAYPAGYATVATALGVNDTVVGLGGPSASGTLRSLMVPRATIKIDQEKMIIDAFEEPTRTIRVTRGAHGTVATSHVVGAPLLRSNNSLLNIVRLPLRTTDAHTYVFTWDGYWTDSYIGSGAQSHKAFQFSSGGDRVWLEPRVRFDGGTRAFEQSGLFDIARDVGAVDMRCYNFIGGGTDWLLTNGDMLGPGMTVAQPCHPRTDTPTFVVKPNTWTRFWVRIEQRANDYDYVDFWIADETTGPVQMYRQMPVSVRSTPLPAHSIQKFWLEYNTSVDLYLRGNERDLVAYVRNFVALQQSAPSDMSGVLLRPGISTPPPPVGPLPPANIKVIRK